MERWQILISTILAVATFAFGIWKYSDNAAQETASARIEAEALRLEARRPYLTRQFDLCFEASETASTLSTTHNANEWQKSLDRFWVLYYGPLAIVETPLEGAQGKVEGKMVSFGNALKNIPEITNFSSISKKSQATLQSHALAISHACRDLIIDSWGLKK
ncbi:MAG: hypothetical protein V7727_13800 [Sneathiella sp.]